MISAAISKIKVLADAVVEGKSANQPTNQPACPSLQVWSTYLPRSAHDQNQGCFLCYCFLTQTAFYFSINRCHLVSIVCKYSTRLLRTSEVSRTKNHQFLPAKAGVRKTFQKAILGLGLKGQGYSARRRPQGAAHTVGQDATLGGSRPEAPALAPVITLWPCDHGQVIYPRECLISKMKTGPSSWVWPRIKWAEMAKKIKVSNCLLFSGN